MRDSDEGYEETKHLFRSYSVCFYRDMLPPIIDSGRRLMLRVLYTSGDFLVASKKPVLGHQLRVASRWLQSVAPWPLLYPRRSSWTVCSPVNPPEGLLESGVAAGPVVHPQSDHLRYSFPLVFSYSAACFLSCARKGISYLSRIIEIHIHLFTSA